MCCKNLSVAWITTEFKYNAINWHLLQFSSFFLLQDPPKSMYFTAV